jgi:hypothetical protein
MKIEIRAQILGHVLTAKAPVAPKSITNTRQAELELPGYVIANYSERLVKSTVHIPRQDKAGPYEEIRYIYRKPIDATCLRVNKQFWTEGSAILYGHNTFEFTEIPQCIQAFGQIYTMGDQGAFIQRWSQKPALKNIGNHNFRRDVSQFMEGRGSDDNLKDWIYCDPFLRFLYTIGPSNAASLKSICLEGQVMRHCTKDPLVCEPECRDGCLRYCLKLYGPFLQRYCSEIKRLTLRLQLRSCDLIIPKRMERDLIAIIKSEMASFPSLRELAVADIDETPLVAGAELMKRVQAH